MTSPALDDSAVSPNPWRLILVVVGSLLALWLTVATRTANQDLIFIPSGPDKTIQTYFVDADCYSRMTRVAMVMAQPGLILKQHAFENAPIGTYPHTTVLMDYLIAIPGWMVGAERAGAWIGPALALLGAIFLIGWAWRTGLEAGGAFWLLAAYILSPMLAAANVLGRPDHQALLTVLLLVAVAAELALLNRSSRPWAIVAGAAWGLALWTSLYEPMFFLGASVVLVGGLGWRTWNWKARAWEAGVLVGIVLLALIIEGGVRLNVPGAGADAAMFKNWAGSISEMGSPGGNLLALLASWVGGPAVFAAPILLGVNYWKTRDSRTIFIGALFVFMLILSAWQLRWAPYLCLVYALTLPWQIAWLQGKWRWALHGGLTLLLIFPAASLWDRTVFPRGADQARVEETKADAVLGRKVAETIKLRLVTEEGVIVTKENRRTAFPRTIMAPWWTTPWLVYWSGAPGVAGSSHQALAGTVDSAKFYAETNWETAARLLKARQVRWVVAYEPQRVLSVSKTILGDLPPYGPGRSPLGRTLYDAPHEAPNYLRLTQRNQFFVLYEVRPEVIDRWLEETAKPAQP